MKKRYLRTLSLLSFFVSSALAQDYEIYSSARADIKVMTRPLSSYDQSELATLPIFERQTLRILVPVGQTKERYSEILKSAVERIRKENPNLDSVEIFAYDRKKDVEDGMKAYTIGKIDWRPRNGVNPVTAVTNDRSNYEYLIDIRNNVGTPEAIALKQDIKNKRATEDKDQYSLKSCAEVKRYLGGVMLRPDKSAADNENETSIWEEHYDGKKVSWELTFKEIESIGPFKTLVFLCDEAEGSANKLITFEADDPTAAMKNLKTGSRYKVSFTLYDYRPLDGELIGINPSLKRQ